MLALVLAGSVAGAAGAATAGTAGAAPPHKLPTCAQVISSMANNPVDSWQFRYLSMKACTGSWY